MKRTSIILIIIISGCLGIAAQTPDCPKITITGPDGVTVAGDTMTFTANISPFDQNITLDYNWTVSAGTIGTGQGTPSIIVRSEMTASNVRATVKIGGFPVGCADTAFEEAGVSRTADYYPADEFGQISRGDAKARLLNLYIRLDNDPLSEGVIVVRFNRKDTRQAKILYLNKLIEAIAWLKKDLARVSFEISEGGSETITTIHIVTPDHFKSYTGIDESRLIKGEDLKTKMKTLFLKK